MDGGRDDLSRAPFALFLGLALHLADDARHIPTGILFHLRQQHTAGFFGGHLRDALQLFHLVRVQFFDLVGALVNHALAFVQQGLAFFQAVGAPVHLFAALLQAVFLAAQLAAPAGHLGLGRLADLQRLIFGLQLGGVRLLLSRGQNILGLGLQAGLFLLGQVVMDAVPAAKPSEQSEYDDDEPNPRIHKVPSSFRILFQWRSTVSRMTA